MRVRHDARAAGAQLRFARGGVFERHFVVEASVAGFDQAIVVCPKVKQHGFLQPFVHDPLAVAFFRDAQLARVEALQAFLERLRQPTLDGRGSDFLAPIPGGFDRALEGVRHGRQSYRGR